MRRLGPFPLRSTTATAAWRKFLVHAALCLNKCTCVYCRYIYIYICLFADAGFGSCRETKLKTKHFGGSPNFDICVCITCLTTQLSGPDQQWLFPNQKVFYGFTGGVAKATQAGYGDVLLSDEGSFLGIPLFLVCELYYSLR